MFSADRFYLDSVSLKACEKPLSQRVARGRARLPLTRLRLHQTPNTTALPPPFLRAACVTCCTFAVRVCPLWAAPPFGRRTDYIFLPPPARWRTSATRAAPTACALRHRRLRGARSARLCHHRLHCTLPSLAAATQLPTRHGRRAVPWKDELPRAAFMLLLGLAAESVLLGRTDMWTGGWFIYAGRSRCLPKYHHNRATPHYPQCPNSPLRNCFLPNACPGLLPPGAGYACGNLAGALCLLDRVLVCHRLGPHYHLIVVSFVLISWFEHAW